MWGVFSMVLNVLLYPATVAHELTHVLVLAPWTTRRDVDMAPTQGTARLRVETQDVPVWVGRVGALAPTLFGLVAGLLSVLFALGVLESVARDPAVACAVAAYWFSYTCPSLADVTEAVG